MRKYKVAVWGGLTKSLEKKGRKKQRRKENLCPTESRAPKNSKERQENLLSDQCKEIEENNRMGKTRELFKKIRDTKGTFYAKMDTKKGQKWYGPNRIRRY